MILGTSYDKNGFVIYKINDDNFEEYAKIITDLEYEDTIQRAIYIDDVLYTLSKGEIISYNLESMEKIKELELEK